MEHRLALADLASLPSPGPQGEPAWLSERRQRAAEWLADHGFPTKKDEDWRYVDLRPLLAMGFALPRILGDVRFDDMSLDGLAGLPGLGGPRLVLLNGRFAPGLSRLTDPPDGVRVTPLADAIRVDDRAVRDVWRQPAEGWRHGFEALNVALAVDGAFVQVAEAAAPDVPIEIVHVALGDQTPPVSNPRTLVRVGAGGSASIVETYLGAGDGPSLTNAHTEIVLDEGAALDHCRFQVETAEAYHLSSVHACPGRDARFASHLVANGAHLGRHELLVVLTAEGATADLDGVYLPRGVQCHDNPVRVEHVAPACTSHQLYKAIVDGAGHGIFNGHVIVHPGAAGTDAQQVNKSLLLSEQAEVDTRPRLEIFADDVACTHGAAVGQLDLDALFYLRSRGISEPDARRIVIAGFAQEVLGRIPAGALRGRAEALITAHLEDGDHR
ncbi:MAG TPA: Fe-S cluster assembly protein SufD [Acidimicrobiales bacterium]|nr:Fe-S cluster assembly protein SufD [Acidimicrobiales bacterium]